MAQRDLLRITSTFQAMELLESYYNGQKGEHNISIVRLGADEHSIMGGKIGIMCVSEPSQHSWDTGLPCRKLG